MDALRYLLHRGDVDVDREYGKGWTVLSVACTTKAIPVTVMKMCVVGMCLSWVGCNEANHHAASLLWALSTVQPHTE